MDLNDVTELLDNPLVSGIFLVALLVLAYYFAYSLWTYVFTVFLTYFVADMVVKLILAGGGGIFQFRPFGTETQSHGHALLIFACVIIFSAFVSVWATDFITKNIIMNSADLSSVVIPIAVIVFLVFVNMHVTYLKR